MKRVCMLLWREWRENRWFLYAGLLLLLIIPAVGLRPVPLSSPDPYAASNHMVGVRQIADITCAFAVILGGLLAVVVGVAAGCRDMRGRVSDFWRSRPVTLGSWLSARYLAGLATVLVATSVPLLAVWVLLLVAEPIMNYSGGYACANGIHIDIKRLDGDLCPGSGLPDNIFYIDDSLANLRNLQLKKFSEKTRMRP